MSRNKHGCILSVAPKTMNDKGFHAKTPGFQIALKLGF